MISWRSKKQNTIAKCWSWVPSYRKSCIQDPWLELLLHQLKFGYRQDTQVKCDNEATIHIASSPIFHEGTKHINLFSFYETKCSMEKSSLTLSTVMTNLQTCSVNTWRPHIEHICDKLDSWHIRSNFQLEGKSKRHYLVLAIREISIVRDISNISHY